MINIPLKIDLAIANFEANVSDLLETWLNLMMKKQYEEAEILCVEFVNKYGSAFNQRLFKADDETYNRILILLILVWGLHEYVQLCVMTKCSQWHKLNSNVEQVWIKLCDCRERLNFSLQFYQGEVTARVVQSLDELEDFFKYVFGNGTYLSPGIIVDKYLCSICHKDSRACSHIAGRLYSGKIAYYSPVNPQPDHVAIVKVPKDKRCRIWSWNMKDNDNGKGATIKAPILTMFSVDNFLRNI